MYFDHSQNMISFCFNSIEQHGRREFDLYRERFASLGVTGFKSFDIYETVRNSYWCSRSLCCCFQHPEVTPDDVTQYIHITLDTHTIKQVPRS